MRKSSTPEDPVRRVVPIPRPSDVYLKARISWLKRLAERALGDHRHCTRKLVLSKEETAYLIEIPVYLEELVRLREFLGVNVPTKPGREPNGKVLNLMTRVEDDNGWRQWMREGRKSEEVRRG